jgi:kinesin family protein 11
MEGGIDQGPDSKDMGVIPRAVHTIFKRLHDQGKEHSIKVSALEIYNEELCDLLANDGKALRLFDDTTGKKGVQVHGLEEVLVANAAELFKVLRRSSNTRSVASTLMNEKSSRSHCIFTITVHTKESDLNGEDIIRTGRLHLVDLAGSECIGKSGATNARAKEAGKINLSLLSLGRVISALVEHKTHIPYRESKLTRLLQESLGGKAKTVIIATVSPSISAIDETVSTLEYANRAKNIKNTPQVNMKMTGKAYMRELIAEIATLKREIECARAKDGVILPPEIHEKNQLELKQKREEVINLHHTLACKEDEFKEATEGLLKKSKDLSRCMKEKAYIDSLLAATKDALSSVMVDADSTRVELEAEKLIVTEYAKTEEVNVRVIHEVGATLDSVAKDKNALHDKIGRKSKVEEHNRLVSTAVAEEVTTRLTSSQAACDRFVAAEQKSASSMTSSIEELVATNNECINDISVGINQMSAAMMASLDEVTRLTSAHRDGMARVADDMLDNGVEYHAAVASQLDGVRSATTEASANLTIELTKHESDLKDIANEINATYEASVRAVGEFVGEQKVGLTSMGDNSNEFANDVDKEAASQRAYLAEFESKLKVSAEARMTTMMSKVMEGIQMQFTLFAQQSAEEIAMGMEHMRVNLDRTRAAAKQHAVSMMTHTSSLHTANTSYHAATVDRTSAASSRTRQLFGDAGERTTSISHHVGEAQSSLIGRVDTMSSGNSVRVNSIREHVANHRRSVSDFGQSHTRAITKVNTTRDEGVAAHGKAIVKMTKQVVDGASSLTNITNSDVARVISYQTEASSANQFMRSALSQFIERDFKADIKTGGTPERREIARAPSAHRTRPHDAIVTEIRAERTRQLAELREKKRLEDLKRNEEMDLEALRERERAVEAENHVFVPKPSTRQRPSTSGTNSARNSLSSAPAVPLFNASSSSSAASSTAPTPLGSTTNSLSGDSEDDNESKDESSLLVTPRLPHVDGAVVSAGSVDDETFEVMEPGANLPRPTITSAILSSPISTTPSTISTPSRAPINLDELEFDDDDEDIDSNKGTVVWSGGKSKSSTTTAAPVTTVKVSVKENSSSSANVRGGASTATAGIGNFASKRLKTPPPVARLGSSRGGAVPVAAQAMSPKPPIPVQTPSRKRLPLGDNR